jgi:hypothetical protein
VPSVLLVLVVVLLQLEPLTDTWVYATGAADRRAVDVRWGTRGALARCPPPASLDTPGPACCAGHRPGCPFISSGSSVGQRGVIRPVYQLAHCPSCWQLEG